MTIDNEGIVDYLERLKDQVKDVFGVLGEWEITSMIIIIRKGDNDISA